MTSDEALMLEFQGGSRAAFEGLFARYRKPLYGFFGRRLNSLERAEDLAPETFLAVIRAASRYEPRASVRTYRYGIALKLLAAARRKLSTSSTWGQSAPEPKADGTPELNALRLVNAHIWLLTLREADIHTGWYVRGSASSFELSGVRCHS